MKHVIKKHEKKQKPFVVPASQLEKTPGGGESAAADWSSVAFSSFINTEIAKWKGRASSIQKERDREMAGEVERAFDEGYQKGLADGVEKERQDRIKSIDALLAEAKKMKHNAIHDLEVKIIDLGVTIAEKIIRQSIHTDPSVAESIVEETMNHIIGSEKIVLKVSQDDFKVINNKYNKWMGMAGGVSEFKIEIDKRLRAGDYIIESEGGIIDGIVRDRINVIVEELLKVSH